MKPSKSPQKIPFFRPDITDREIEEVVATLRSGWITTGPKVARFEEEFAAAMGVPWAVGISSCTAALHACLVAAGCGPGTRVVTTVNTFTATAAAILHAGATPVLVDIEEETFNMDPEAAARACGEGCAAIIPVHIAGHPCEMDRIGEAARVAGAVVIEDAAHALPASYRGARVGSLSEMTCFSFYATKNLTTGEGGMITGKDPGLRERLRLIGYHGMSKDGWKRYTDRGSWHYEIVEDGFKYNLTDIAAAMGLRQLERLDGMQARRAEVVAAYDRGFSDLEPLILPGRRPHVEHAWHLYIVRLREGMLRLNRDAFLRALSERGVATSVHFIPLHRHSFYRDRLHLDPASFPVAEKVFDSCFSLPLFSCMEPGEVEAVISRVRDLVKESLR